MRWEQGRPAIERMLAGGELQRVPASRGQAERLLAQARGHVASALKVCDEDPPGGYALAYDGARKALNRMRIRRHDAEYPPADSPEITAADVREDQATAEGLIDIAARLLDEMSPF